jgi:hypothetical protein
VILGVSWKNFPEGWKAGAGDGISAVKAMSSKNKNGDMKLGV